MDEISFKDKQEIFARLEKIASQANLSPEERARYEEERKRYNDYFNTLASARKLGHMDGYEEGHREGLEKGLEKGFEKGREQGLKEEKYRNARNLKSMGIDVETISQAIGLSIEEIENL